ncbi:GNAT family N-acetyltransferase [Phenylobacterium sp.]|uniref:GNAT family N-acetyltransferase n=1 Tax=Phenylobacterium sp. TaxID=1871053 RepID=UPI00271AC9FE|nr:GNAT family N-acetyltransferase [Phenylobacterium sp.]MDO8380347.1 GNAT family N-acetyltransferase [Phenylobacterium sp.]
MGLTIQPLARTHDRRAFSCGQDDLDAWFRRQAGQDTRRDVARVFVAVDDDLGIVGFYSLGAFSLAITDLPPALADKLPRYDAIPAALIGRLARDARVRGQGMGDLLLADAIGRVLEAGTRLGIFAILVDAKDARAAAFYQTFGFQPFPSRLDRMFLLTATARAAMERLQTPP